MAADLIRDIAAGALAAREWLSAPGKRIEAALARHPDATLIRSLPGMEDTLTHELSAARARDLRATTRSRGGPTACPPRSFDADPEPKWLQGHLGQHRSLHGIRTPIAADSRNRKRSAVALSERNPQVTAMISVQRAARGHLGGTFRTMWSPDTRSKNAHDLEPPYGIEP